MTETIFHPIETSPKREEVLIHFAIEDGHSIRRVTRKLWCTLLGTYCEKGDHSWCDKTGWYDADCNHITSEGDDCYPREWSEKHTSTEGKSP